jgi:hypothetical protein
MKFQRFSISAFQRFLSPGFRIGSVDGFVRQVPGDQVACRTLQSVAAGRVNVHTSTGRGSLCLPRPDLISTGGGGSNNFNAVPTLLSPQVGLLKTPGARHRFSQSCAARFFSKVIFWFTTKRLCMWCEPHHWLGGNPFARQHTGGMCPKAQAKFLEGTK